MELHTQTAGPFLRFRTWNCTPDLSMIRPARPSSASISLMMVPLPMPPKLGLQEHVPRLSILGVTKAVRAPDLAAAAHASAPACPPPITTTSNGLEDGQISASTDENSVANLLTSSLKRRSQDIAVCRRAIGAASNWTVVLGESAWHVVADGKFGSCLSQCRIIWRNII